MDVKRKKDEKTKEREGKTRSLTNEVRKSRKAGKATQYREAEA
jgi:hypothetical protein